MALGPPPRYSHQSRCISYGCSSVTRGKPIAASRASLSATSRANLPVSRSTCLTYARSIGWVFPTSHLISEGNANVSGGAGCLAARRRATYCRDRDYAVDRPGAARRFAHFRQPDRRDCSDQLAELLLPARAGALLWLGRALSAALHTFASLAAWVVVTNWATLLSALLVLLILVGMRVSH